MANDITNVGLNETKTKSAENNRSTNQTALDKIGAVLARANKDANRMSTNGEFYGFVLYCHRLSADQFYELFNGNDKFITDVVTRAGVYESNPAATFLETYVYIPQITDFLPKPDLKILFDLLKFKNELSADANVSSVLQQLLQPFPANFNERVGVSDRDLNPAIPRVKSEKTKELENTLALNSAQSKIRKNLIETVAMYPKVYEYVEDGRAYSSGQACKVEFSDKSFPSMGYGYFLSQIDGFMSLEGPGIDEQIKKLVEGAK